MVRETVWATVASCHIANDLVKQGTWQGDNLRQSLARSLDKS